MKINKIDENDEQKRNLSEDVEVNGMFFDSVDELFEAAEVIADKIRAERLNGSGK